MFRIGRASGKTNLEIEIIKHIVKKEIEQENKRVEKVVPSKHPSLGKKFDFYA